MNESQIKQIQDLCWQRIGVMEDASSFGDIPNYAFDLYSLYYFIMVRNFQKYFDNFGLQNVDINNAARAKEYFSFPKFSPFERDVANLLNEFIDGKRRKDGARTDNPATTHSIYGTNGTYVQGRGQPPAVITTQRATG